MTSTDDGKSSPEAHSDKSFVQPIHVVAAGSAVVCTGALLTATLTYRAGTKDLVEDGINPSSRLKVIPVAARTLALSTLLTGLFGVAGFYALKQRGFFVTDRAELPNATEAARLLRNPRAFFTQLLRGGPEEEP